MSDKAHWSHVRPRAFDCVTTKRLGLIKMRPQTSGSTKLDDIFRR